MDHARRLPKVARVGVRRHPEACNIPVSVLDRASHASAALIPLTADLNKQTTGTQPKGYAPLHDLETFAATRRRSLTRNIVARGASEVAAAEAGATGAAAEA